MARDASVAKAGYYPLDDAGFDDLATVLCASTDYGDVAVLDPCAGKGEVLRLTRALGERYARAWRELPTTHEARLYHRSPRNPCIDLRLIEMEETRTAAAATRFNAEDATAFRAWHDSADYSERGGGFPRPTDCVIAEGDAFCVPVPTCGWASLLYLNPPYDADDHRRGGRVEERWLERFSAFCISDGVLAFVVPLAAVGASAQTLARGWRDVQIGRVREGSASAAFAATQVIVLARRVWPELAAPDPGTLRTIEIAVAGGVEKLPGVAALRPIVLPVGVTGCAPRSYVWRVEELDYTQAASECRPWMRSVRRAAPGGRRMPPLVPLRETLPARPWAELTAREYPTLMQLKPSYVADAIASGALDGELVEPADPNAGLPTLRVKGMFDRRFREIEVKYDSKGEARASVQVQRPALRVSILTPAGEVHVLGDSALPTSTTDPACFTVGDLVTLYGPSLAAALGRRCPVTGDAALVPTLPTLRRALYPAQAAAVRAIAGHLLQAESLRRTGGGGVGGGGGNGNGGRTPAVLLQGQPGTGKTSMCLAAAAALGARRVLVVCPPHLVAEEAAWRSDAVAVLGPGCDVRVLETPVDVDRFEQDPDDDGRMRIGIASREVAKLGHGYEGLQTCPRCGTRDLRDPAKLASTRGRCKAPALVATGPRRLRRAAELAARALAWCELESPEVTERLPAGSFMARARRRMGRSSGFVATAAAAAVTEVRAWARGQVKKNPTPTETQTRNIETIREMCDAVVQAGAGGSIPTQRLLAMLRGVTPMRAAGAPRRTKDDGWKRGVECGEQLWQATPRPRRWPLVRSLVVAAKRGAFDLLVLDEAHEYGNFDSAQAQAAERLVAAGIPTILATGTVCNGYMSSMHAHFRALSADYARDFARDDRPRAVARFGYQRRQVDLRANENKASESDGGSGDGVELGAVSDRVVKGGVRVIGQAPGVLPEALLRYLAPATAQVHLEDLGESLPPLREDLVVVVPTDVQRAGLDYLASALKARIRADRKDKEKAGKLFGQFAELPSFLDRCALRPEWVVSYPATDAIARRNGERGPEVARLPCMDEGKGGRTIGLPRASEVLPKETALVEWCAAQLRRGRPCLVYVWHWDLMPRITAALRTGLAAMNLGGSVAGAAGGTDTTGRWIPHDPETGVQLRVETARVDVLDPGKVPPIKREAWIAKSSAGRCAVLLTNPAAVKTGINSLARWWCSAGWYEGPGCSPEIRRQATHRLWRIGQRRAVEVASFVYENTMQAKLHELLLHKVGVSEAVDGLDATAALTAAGVGEGDALASLEVGRALFEWCDRA